MDWDNPIAQKLIRVALYNYMTTMADCCVDDLEFQADVERECGMNYEVMIAVVRDLLSDTPPIAQPTIRAGIEKLVAAAVADLSKFIPTETLSMHARIERPLLSPVSDCHAEPPRRGRKKKAARLIPADQTAGHYKVRCDMCSDIFHNAVELGRHKTMVHYGSNSLTGSSLAP